DNFASLRERTLQFSHAMITSSMPAYVIDAAISAIASLKTPLLTQNQNSNLNGLSSSPYTLNDAQILAALYPSLEKNMLETLFMKRAPEYQEKSDDEKRWLSNKMEHEFYARVDGYLKNIMRVYRQWKTAGDNAWLGYVWPGVKSSIEYIWKGGDYEGRIIFDDPLDPLKEGVLRGAQPTTYDMVLYGPNMLTGSLYLGALKACAEMADAMNEPQKAQEYKRIYNRGKQKYQTLLWNGEYYEQSIEISNEERIPNWMLTNGEQYASLNEKVIDEQERGSLKYQVGTGCLSDQLIGQYLAFLSGSGYIMDTLSTQKAFQSIYKYNFRETMRDVENVYSVFAANDDSGLINCSWPGNDRPFLPMVYAEEVWVDVEYRVAASLIFSGQLVEGLNIVEAMRKRYDGSARNPFNAKKTAGNNAPALSAWSVYQAMSGYSYNGLKGTMKFSPAEDVLPHRYIWTTDRGWGTITASRAKVELKCLSGELELDKFSLEGKAFFVFREFNTSHPVTISYEDNELVVHFDKSLQLNANESFAMELP
ncbi:MAG TPA: GH116 family glycosyl hydrolase, partial [Bacteroidales bacterium]|nr:GH116 family glycosyl hydrolase [Bacteroidales bacterium]